MAVCGESPASLFDPALGLDVDAQSLRGVSFKRAWSLLSGQAIKTTAGGAWGDWRMDTNLWFYLLPPAQTTGMRESEKVYRALSHRPVLAHGFDHPQLARMTNFTPLTLDNTTLVPPTVPTGRRRGFQLCSLAAIPLPRSEGRCTFRACCATSGRRAKLARALTPRLSCPGCRASLVSSPWRA